MNFCAIIAEFNPFHNGHKYLIKQAKKIGLPLLCLMSGDFVQRGEMACVDKFSRAKCAIDSGADMVVQLPTVYSLSCAQVFAKGAIKLLKDFGCSHLIVGVTHTNIQDYLDLANIKNSNLKSAITSQLETGTTYSQALINVLKAKHPNCEKIFTDASNILALEYIEQIVRQKANIEVTLVKRTDGGYNNNFATTNFANASTIRNKLMKNEDCSQYVPVYAKSQFNQIVSADKIDEILLYNLRKASAQDLKNCYDYTEGLPYLINSAAKSQKTLSEVIQTATCKRYRLARIKKLCIYPTLNITKENFNQIMRGRPAAKLLAIKTEYKKLISQINNKNIKLIVSHQDYKRLTKSQQLSAQIDLDTSNLFALASNQSFNRDILIGTLFIK